ncbi:hypothetical protein GJ744_010531 [Endocarpon pusillum]|uniref:Uncharacterized protein n=1 Tax=Endocarpon pusillum TaxID=364733 RepID=A0A8H7APM8_9EURO|nr:hypothetical protein GJ744_010531 [Endocarpon pusillum]
MLVSVIGKQPNQKASHPDGTRWAVKPGVGDHHTTLTKRQHTKTVMSGESKTAKSRFQDVERRHEKDKADMELRFKEGTPTLQDFKWRQRLQDRKRHEEEAARRAKALQEEKEQEMRDRQMSEERNHRQKVEARLAGVHELLMENLIVQKRRGGQE